MSVVIDNQIQHSSFRPCQDGENREEEHWHSGRRLRIRLGRVWNHPQHILNNGSGCTVCDSSCSAEDYPCKRTDRELRKILITFIRPIDKIKLFVGSPIKFGNVPYKWGNEPQLIIYSPTDLRHAHDAVRAAVSRRQTKLSIKNTRLKELELSSRRRRLSSTTVG